MATAAPSVAASPRLGSGYNGRDKSRAKKSPISQSVQSGRSTQEQQVQREVRCAHKLEGERRAY
ncbi:hypothetical protein EMIT0373P_20952 [Pseudomonas chlororaphis]